MIDAVLSYHENPLVCGVTKFNVQLAARLGVPHDHVSQARRYRHPLLSAKASEVALQLCYVCFTADALAYDVLWHDKGQEDITAFAKHVMYASDIGCPSTVCGDHTRGTLDILSFGMAHKTQVVHFERLKALLDQHEGDSYTISLSTAVHEGSPWDEAIAENISLMRGIFGDHLRVLGFLADDALARELRSVQACALFFDPAARANNTSLWAAAEAGCPIVTNLDADSPKELAHLVSVFDLIHMTGWPDPAHMREVRHGATRASQVYSWDRVIAALTSEVHA